MAIRIRTQLSSWFFLRPSSSLCAGTNINEAKWKRETGLYFVWLVSTKRIKQTNHLIPYIHSAQFPNLVYNKPQKHLCQKGLWNKSLWQDLQCQNSTSFKCLQNSDFRNIYKKGVNYRRYATLLSFSPRQYRNRREVTWATLKRNEQPHYVWNKIVSSYFLF